MPSHAFLHVAKSTMLPVMKVNEGFSIKEFILDRNPVDKSSSTRTSFAPCFNKYSTRCEPIKPAPPVTRNRRWEMSSVCQAVSYIFLCSHCKTERSRRRQARQFRAYSNFLRHPLDPAQFDNTVLHEKPCQTERSRRRQDYRFTY